MVLRQGIAREWDCRVVFELVEPCVAGVVPDESEEN